MLLRCNRCHSEFISQAKITSGNYVCTKCNPRNLMAEQAGLGLHPLLEKKWGNLNSKRQTIIKKESEYVPGPSKHTIKNKTYLGLDDSYSVMSPALGKPVNLPKIPGFELSYQVGKGAMGSVYRARQISTGRLVAIKILSKELSMRSDLVARFEREAYALKSLKHENVVSIIDAGQVEDTHYFVMEFIEGMTLRTRINRGGISVEEACFIIEKMLKGLDVAHRVGIIHRDLKPENVLLAYVGSDFSKMPQRVVLVDFGLVGIGGLAFDPHPNLTRSKVTMGTVNYMAPEQHVDAKRVDQRTDLYSAGVILFEMITGELPLGRYFLPFERGMNVLSDIDEILAKALARPLEERYGNSKQFLHDLLKLKEEGQKKEQKQKAEEPAEIKMLNFKKAIIESLKRYRYHFLLLIAISFIFLGVKMSLSNKVKDIKAPSKASHSLGKLSLTQS